MKAPFYNLILDTGGNGRDISSFVEGITVDEQVEKDNMIVFDVRSEYAEDMADDDDLVSGKNLKVRFGYAGGLISNIHLGRISDLEPTYGDRVKLKVRAFDKGIAIKRIPSQKVWKGVTSSDIAKEIAGKYGLQPDVEDTTHVWESYPQGNKDDFSFLKELANKEKDGDFVFFVTSNELKFIKRDFSKKAVREFRYGESEIIEFKPKLREHTQAASSNIAKGIAVNPKTKKVVKSEEKPKTNNVLGIYDINFSVNGDFVSKTEKRQKEGSKKVKNPNKSKNEPFGSGGIVGNIIRGVGDLTDQVMGLFPMPGGDVSNIENNLKNSTKGIAKAKKYKVLEATLKIEGNPTIGLNEVITVSNVARRYQGNWRVVGVKNTITVSSAYTTTLNLVKDGTSKPTKASAVKNEGKVNKTQGKKESAANKEVKVVKFDANGNKID